MAVLCKAAPFLLTARLILPHLKENECIRNAEIFIENEYYTFQLDEDDFLRLKMFAKDLDKIYVSIGCEFTNDILTRAFINFTDETKKLPDAISIAKQIKKSD